MKGPDLYVCAICAKAIVKREKKKDLELKNTIENCQA